MPNVAHSLLQPQLNSKSCLWIKQLQAAKSSIPRFLTLPVASNYYNYIVTVIASCYNRTLAILLILTFNFSTTSSLITRFLFPEKNRVNCECTVCKARIWTISMYHTNRNHVNREHNVHAMYIVVGFLLRLIGSDLHYRHNINL